MEASLTGSARGSSRGSRRSFRGGSGGGGGGSGCRERPETTISDSATKVTMSRVRSQAAAEVTDPAPELAAPADSSETTISYTSRGRRRARQLTDRGDGDGGELSNGGRDGSSVSGGGCAGEGFTGEISALSLSFAWVSQEDSRMATPAEAQTCCPSCSPVVTSAALQLSIKQFDCKESANCENVLRKSGAEGVSSPWYVICRPAAQGAAAVTHVGRDEGGDGAKTCGTECEALVPRSETESSFLGGSRKEPRVLRPILRLCSTVHSPAMSVG